MAAIALTAGCWDEIHYQPPAHAPKAQAAKTTPNEPEVGSAASKKTTAEAASEPSTDELFGGESSPPPAVVNLSPPAFDPPPIAAETVTTRGASITPQQRLDAWTLASAWSLAAAISAKGLGSDRYEPMLVEAQRAATALGVDLPPLPTVEADSADQREAAVIAALRNGAAADLVSSIARRLDDAAGAAAQLAIDSHLLLLSYSSGSADAAEAASAIRTAGETAKLSAELWQPLFNLLIERADFKAVRGAVFDLHQGVAGHLKSLATP